LKMLVCLVAMAVLVGGLGFFGEQCGGPSDLMTLNWDCRDDGW
jgi:hypothetical protein